MKVNMSKADTLYVIGDEIDPAQWEQTLVPGNTTWIGVPTQATMSVTEAFQGIEPVEGDIVSSEDETSIFDGQNWYGELSSIIPGKGYTYYNNSDVSKQLVFPATSLTGLTGYYKPRQGIAANYKYASRMVAVCTVHGDYQETLSDAVIEAYDEYGELRGQSKALLRDSIRVVFISGDNDGEPVVLNARLADGRQFVRMLPQGFQRNGHLGTLRAPFVIDPTTTGIGTLPLVKGMIAVYNLSGLPVYHGPAADFMHKQMLHAEPLIVVETTDDGRPRVYKLK